MILCLDLCISFLLNKRFSFTNIHTQNILGKVNQYIKHLGIYEYPLILMVNNICLII